MCFSATASFVAGTMLSSIGMVTLIQTKGSRLLPLALIPLLFGIQQFIEGFLWLSFQHESPLLTWSTTYAFTMFSHVLWPIFVPFAVGLIEPVPWRRKTIALFQYIGWGVGLFLLYLVVRYPVTAIAEEHIVYVSQHFYKVPVMILYVAATCVSSFFSSYRLIKIFGVLALILFFVAYGFYTVALLSVWCFFAAVLSAILYLHIRDTQAKFDQPAIERI
jgi:hypothetical protein